MTEEEERELFGFLDGDVETTSEEVETTSESASTQSEYVSDLPFDEGSDTWSIDLVDKSAQPKVIYTELSESMENALSKAIDELCFEGGADKVRIVETQRPIIEKILLAFLNGMEAFVLEAPTGSGKSIIAFLVVRSISIFLHQDIGTGYIITASKALQEQLEKDTQWLHLKGFACLKGMSNYTCDKNFKLIPQRDCIDMSFGKVLEKLDCSKTCEYMQRKRKAIVSECAIFSYAYWLTTMNYVHARIGEYAPFQNRMVTVFDECHALMDCVQSMFMISLNMMRIQHHLDKLQDSLLYCVSGDEADIVNRALDQKNWLFDNVEGIFEKDIALAEMLGRVEHWNLALKDYCMICNTCKSSNDKRNVEKKQLARHLEYFETLSDTIGYFIENAKGFEEWIAHRIKYEGENRILEIQTLKEDVLYAKHVKPFTGFTLLMSATIGDIETFATNLGLEKYDFAYMSSSFKFENCPIYKTSPMYNMGMKYKDKNMGFLLKRIVDICDILHPEERGIIHTGNFEIARKLKEYVATRSKTPKRYCFYDNSEDKELILANHKHSKNSIVIGPSLTEGIDLKDDLARFQILAKVPYPALDDFNKVHMKLVPNWYHWTTLVTFLQSIGRGIRHADDYATTYLLDAGFNYFLKNTTLQPYIANRIEQIQIEPLLYPNADDDLFDF